MDRKKLLALLIAAAVVLTGCGNPEEATSEQRPSGAASEAVPVEGQNAGIRFTPGEEAAIALPCDPGPRPALHDPITLGQWFDLTNTAIRLNGDRFAELARPPLVSSADEPEDEYYEIHPGANAEAMIGDLPEVYRIYPSRFDVLQTFAPGRTIVLAIGGSGRWATGLAAIIDNNGALVFEGVCALPYTEQFAAFRSSSVAFANRDPADLLTALFDDTSPEQAAYHDWVAGPLPALWAEKPATARLIDHEIMPLEVFKTLVPVQLSVEIDPDWRQYSPGTLCSFVPGVGWNSCVMLDENTPGVVVFWQYGSPGVDMELWILDEKARIETPITRVGVIEATKWAMLVDE